jgi:hypothetical protein
MRDTLATDRGRKLYAQRKITIEPVFGQIKHNRHIERFMRRGTAAAQSESRLVTATHNLRGSTATGSRTPPDTGGRALKRSSAELSPRSVSGSPFFRIFQRPRDNAAAISAPTALV